jgi:hypothetical protein
LSGKLHHENRVRGASNGPSCPGGGPVRGIPLVFVGSTEGSNVKSSRPDQNLRKILRERSVMASIVAHDCRLSGQTLMLTLCSKLFASARVHAAARLKSEVIPSLWRTALRDSRQPGIALTLRLRGAVGISGGDTIGAPLRVGTIRERSSLR